MTTLIQRLGFDADTRAIILNADDFGMCHAANTAITELLEAGSLDSTTLMVPCPWAPEALAFAASRTDLDIGVHLVLTSEWSRYRWRPLTGTGTTLTDADGYFPRDVLTVEQRADSAEVAIELTAQIDAALAAGVDVTHIDNHMGSVYGLETGRDFLAAAFEVAARHGLPFRLPRSAEGVSTEPRMQQVLDQAVAIADALGIVLPDRTWTHEFGIAAEGTADEEDYERMRAGFLTLLRAVRPGVTEIFLHPMDDTEELRAAVDYAAAKRGWEKRLLADPLVAEVLAEEGLVRVGWRALRDVQRGER